MSISGPANFQNLTRQSVFLFLLLTYVNCIKIQTKLLVFFVHFVIIRKISLFSVKLDNVFIHNPQHYVFKQCNYNNML